MKIQQNVNYNQNFGARINLNSRGIREYTEYLDRCKDAPKGYFCSNKNIKLFKSICKAISRHPSPEVIDADVYYRKGELFNARGVLETSKKRIVDVEPSRSDDGTAPMENLFRKLLNPENKDVFNSLLGKEYEGAYDKWWNKNIKPLWQNIRETYKMEEILHGVTEQDYNKAFRKQV